MKPGKRYKVKWIDAQSMSEWMSLEEIKAIKPAYIEAVYIYLGTSSAGYIFAGESNGTEYGNISIVPKALIKQSTLIK